MARKKTTWQKIWYFIWEDDSVLSWFVNIVIAFILIKYLVYPGLGLVFGTSHPVVAVVSGSMEHKTIPPCVEEKNDVCIKYSTIYFQICGETFPEKQEVDLDFFWDTCGEFYRARNINKLQFEEFPFKNGFNTGDIMVLVGKKPEDINVGDVIVFQGNRPDPVIHRVIEKNEDGEITFTTKGDHNSQILKMEQDITEERIIGKAVFRIPFLGYVKIWFVSFLKMVGLNSTIGRLFS